MRATPNSLTSTNNGINDSFLLLLSRSSFSSVGNGFERGKEGKRLFFYWSFLALPWLLKVMDLGGAKKERKILFYCFFPIGNGFGWGKEGKEDEISLSRTHRSTSIER